MRRGFIVVAIPAKDEAERIGACLLALARQTCRPHAVLVLANNCSDRTPAIASEWPRRCPTDCMWNAMTSQCGTLMQGRRVGWQWLSQNGWVRPDGILLTTDADAVAAPDWIERNGKAIPPGADLVCGRIVLHPPEAALIPAHLHADDALECRLIELLDRIADRLDPDPADPLPRHTEAAGASLAVTRAAFRRAGGIPAVPSGEDRAFVRALARIDARIRHDPSVVVSVSGRTVGRAAGGMADTIRRRMQQQDEFTDEQAEPAVDAYRRYDFRRRVRGAWRRQSLPPELAIDLGIAPQPLRSHARRAVFRKCLGQHRSGKPFPDAPARAIQRIAAPDRSCPPFARA